MGAGVASSGLYGTQPIGANMGGGSQIIGGKTYQQYSPEWYAAMRQYNTDASGAAGTAAGSYTKNYMDTAFPSLAGLSGGGASPLSGLSGLGTGSGAGAVGTGTGSGPVSPGGGIAPIQMPDMTQSNAATFAAAKDKVGQLSRASLDTLNGELGAQGMLGSGAQAQGVRDIVSSNAENLGQVSRDLATQNANTALDVAKTNYGGALAQRGQNIQAQQANAQLALEQRAQQYQLLNILMSGLRGGAPTGGVAPSGGSGLLY